MVVLLNTKMKVIERRGNDQHRNQLPVPNRRESSEPAVYEERRSGHDPGTTLPPVGKRLHLRRMDMQITDKVMHARRKDD